MEVYSSIFDASRKTVKSISADILDDNTYREFEPFVCVGDGSTKCREIWSERNIHFNDTVQLSASGQVELAFNKYVNKQFADLAYFEPNYLKEFYSGK
jgi:tRNA threonylcarbamoyladenosine biosynthesis protein TsaB